MSGVVAVGVCLRAVRVGSASRDELDRDAIPGSRERVQKDEYG